MCKLFIFKISVGLIITFLAFVSSKPQPEPKEWIRINQLGYSSIGPKVAVFVSSTQETIETFELIDAITSKAVIKKKAGKNFGAYSPFQASFRLDFSEYSKQGEYYLKAGQTISPRFSITKDAYRGAADFALR